MEGCSDGETPHLRVAASHRRAQVQTAKTPTAHGEVSTINGFFQNLDASERPPTNETIFLATHQPCSLCMSALAFSGFR